ncbi:MAG: class I SAM-dependent methyltransferase [Candidatus Marinimicrobia bacterium]|nr:class I SAM-dependent methyltransferase [Candidatus Neomarinimicrobiota bacterium]
MIKEEGIRAELKKIYADKINFFNKKAYYWQNVRHATSEHYEVLKQIQLESESRVLDIGCGTGKLFPIIAGLGENIKIVGLDMCKEMLKYAEKFPYPNLETIHSFCEEMPLESNSIDVVFINDTFPHFHNWNLALREIKRVLKNKGHLYLVHSNGSQEVNQTHRNIGPPVANDLLPPLDKLVNTLENFSLKVKKACDTEQYLLICAHKGI